MEYLLTETDLEQLAQWDLPIPRYTSYPPAPSWGPLSAEEAQAAWHRLEGPVSLYVHVPFCASMCLFCGCSVVLNRRPDRQERYVQALLQETSLVAQAIDRQLDVTQIHFGGGTPTTLTADQFVRLAESFRTHFNLATLQEFAVEVDPRTVEEDGGAKLRLLRDLGVNRVSLGIQDADSRVQEAVRRRQSWECSKRTLQLARRLGFEGINVDLIYGLPHQTVASFQETARLIAEQRPDRIALFSYAHVPWIKGHQRAMPEAAMARGVAKLKLYLAAREVLAAAGYRTIGMDHFALPTDPLVHAYEQGQLHRNFQGYTIRYADHLVNLGMSAIGQSEGILLQNAKELESYLAAISAGHLATERGIRLSEEDLRRRAIIQQIMCRFQVDLAHHTPSGQQWQSVYREELAACQQLEQAGMVCLQGSCIEATAWGRLLVRHVARVFDQHTPRELRQFSHAM